MCDQAENLRELTRGTTPALMPGFAPGTPLIVVTGGRAGMGVTTVAVNLAAVMADRGERVLLVDAAREQSNMAEVAGVNWPTVDHPLSAALAGECTTADAIVPGPGGTMLLAAGSRVSPRRKCESRRDSPTWPNANFSRHAQQHLLAKLQSLRSDFDLVVVDVGSRLTPWTRRFWLQAQLVLLVTTTDGSALMDSYATIKLSVADGIGPEIRLVVNQCDDDRLAVDAHCRLANACSRFLGHTLPVAPSLPRYVDKGTARPAPRVWETPNTAYGHAMLWLGRAVGDVLSEKVRTVDWCGTAGDIPDRIESTRSTARC